MPRPNRTFELSVEEMDLIERALLERKTARSNEDMSCSEAREIHELLGRLHNQKIFFRPKSTYVSG